jgi:hypothetical protein
MTRAVQYYFEVLFSDLTCPTLWEHENNCAPQCRVPRKGKKGKEIQPKMLKHTHDIGLFGISAMTRFRELG